MVIAPFALSQTNRVPYVTQTEVLNNATANNLDFSNLINGGDAPQQAAALQELIVEASTKVDTTCMGYAGTLCATVTVEPGKSIPNRQGEFVIKPKYFPILEVRSFAAGWGPGTNMQSIPLSPQNCEIEDVQFTITSQSLLGNTVGVSLNSVLGGGWPTNRRQYVQYTYVSGFANTFLATDVLAGATSLDVLPAPGSGEAVGIYPDIPLTIYDAGHNEGIVVDSTYNGSSLTIPLASPLAYGHPSGTNVSAIPATVKLATIHFICDLAIERGQGGVILEGMGQVTEGGAGKLSGINHEAHAYDLLEEFMALYGRV